MSTDIGFQASDFTFDLLRKLSVDPTQNLFFSPFSIIQALSMTLLGARNETEDEMIKVLRIVKPRIHAELQQINARWAKEAVSTLSVANKLFVQNAYTVLPEFVKATRAFYSSEAQNVDFLKECEKTRQEINAWVSKSTHEKINDLIAPGVLTPDTRLVLVNAIYFKGAWLKQFEPERTRPLPFHLGGGRRTAPVPMMHANFKSLRYAESKTYQTIWLPYKADARLSLMVLLPRDPDGLATLQGELSADALKSLHSESTNVEVNVALPRFKLEYRSDLVGPLGALGMRRLFDPTAADLSGVSGSRDLFVSNVLHQAVVEVNETGTEAAATTAVMMTRMAVIHRDPPKEFTADHPFLFMIMMDDLRFPIFTGILCSP